MAMVGTHATATPGYKLPQMRKSSQSAATHTPEAIAPNGYATESYSAPESIQLGADHLTFDELVLRRPTAKDHVSGSSSLELFNPFHHPLPLFG